MSAPQNPAPLPPAPQFTGAQMAMLAIGGILLLPGLCSIVFALGMLKDIRLSDPIGQTVLVVWGICLAISAVGVILIVTARKQAGTRR